MTLSFSLISGGLFIIFDIFAAYHLLSNKLTYRFPARSILPVHMLAYTLYFIAGSWNEIFPDIPMKLPLLLLYYLVFFVSYTGSAFQRIFWILVFIFITTIGEIIAIPLVMLFTRVPFSDILNHPAAFCIGNILSRSFLLIAVEFLVHLKHLKEYILYDFIKEIFIILLLDVAYFLAFASLFYYNNLFLNVDSAIGLSAISIFMVSTISIYLLYKVVRRSKDMLDTNLRLQQAEMSLQLNQDMTSVVESLRALRHDMNNHMSILQGLVSMQAYDEVSSYLSSITEELQVANSYQFIDNKVLSVLLSSKLSKAAQHDIKVDTEILCGTLPLNNRDLCSLIGNILENAIEAASKHPEPYIFFSIRKTEDTYEIDCDNTYSVKPIIDGSRFISTKENTVYHGIGTKNIRSVVREYHGSVDFIVDEQFHVHITLPA